MLHFAEIVAHPAFAATYMAALFLVTAMALGWSEWRLSLERKQGRRISDILRDRQDPARTLKVLNHVTNARITTNIHCEPDLPPTGPPAAPSATQAAVAIFLALVAATPTGRHALDGLRPASRIIGQELARRLPRLSGAADTVLRLALLGTFIGLIAALAIASSNVGLASDGASGPEGQQIQQFLQQLLATAAAKFWISAAGLGLALVLRLWQLRVEVEASRLARRLGDAFDQALSIPAVAVAWCPNRDGNLDPVTQQLYEIADQIKRSAKNWTLAIQIGANPAAHPPLVTLANHEDIPAGGIQIKGGYQ